MVSLNPSAPIKPQMVVMRARRVRFGYRLSAPVSGPCLCHRIASAAAEFSLPQAKGLFNSVDMIAGFGRVRGAAMLDRPVGGSQEENRACFWDR